MMALPTPFIPAVLVALGLGMIVAGYEPDIAKEVSIGRHIPVCGSVVRINCVVDGDTLWLNGEKIRLLDIDTPEMDGQCSYERQRAIMARDALVEMVSGADIDVRRSGFDKYGRTLATVYANDAAVAEQLIAQNLARRWDGRRRSWC